MPKVASPFWSFREVPSGIKNRNPVQDEFFNSSEALTEISSLVRESIQNSLDAHDPNVTNPVLLCFKLSEVASTVTDEYFNGLEEHLEQGIPGGNHSLEMKPCKYLIVEDFNTTGLLGDSGKDQLTESDIPSKNSYHFLFGQRVLLQKLKAIEDAGVLERLFFQDFRILRHFLFYLSGIVPTPHAEKRKF